jgi:hypothetical protein
MQLARNNEGPTNQNSNANATSTAAEFCNTIPVPFVKNFQFDFNQLFN